MALDFPANPTNGQIYDSYVYNSTVGAWQAREDSATVAITSPTAPTSANNGDIWYNSNTGVSYVYYADGSSAQWVEIVSSAVPSLDSKADVDGGNTFSGSQIINSSITTVTPLIINGITSQSANLQEWRNATGTAQSLINSSGNFFVGSTQSNYTTTTQLGVKARAAAQIPLSVQAAASQTADLQQWQNSGGTVLAEIDSAGILTTPRVISTQTTGTAPFTVASTTAVTNLNADLLDGNHSTAFSPVAGSSLITTVGTITSGTWNGSTVAVANGGTGATTLASGGYLKGAGTGAVTSQTGIPAGDINSGTLTSARLPSGTILQVVESGTGANTATVSGQYSWGNTGIAATITPRSTSSRIKVTANITCSCSAAGWVFMRVLRGSTPVGNGTSGGTLNFSTLTYIADYGRLEPMNAVFVDSPATTAATTYTVQFAVYTGTGYLNRRGADALFGSYSNIILEEIA